MIDLRHGDCLERMKEMESKSVDLILCDPPYELTNAKNTRDAKKAGKGFMGKAWDGTGIAFNSDMWKETYRLLKDDGYLMAFSGTRTYHRMAKAIEEAGFEIVGLTDYTYGSGFPKALSIDKALDKKLGAKREVVGEYKQHNVKGTRFNTDAGSPEYITLDITKPSSDIAKLYEGYKTSLKPSHETIVIARKLSDNNVAPINFLPFVYCAKASKKERNGDIYDNAIDGELKQKIFNGKSSKSSVEMKDVEKRFTTQPAVNNHPTVKPLKIIQELFKQAIDKEEMVVLDMFAGSGTTGVAIEKFNIENGTNHKCILIEKEKEYAEIIKKRCCLEELA